MSIVRLSVAGFMAKISPFSTCVFKMSQKTLVAFTKSGVKDER